MAFVVAVKSIVAIASRSQLHYYQKDCGVKHVSTYFLPDDDLSATLKNRLKSDNTTTVKIDVSKVEIVACAVCTTTGRIAISNNFKQMLVFEPISCDCFYKTLLVKQASAMCFTKDGDKIVISDRYGCVILFDLSNVDSEPQTILGHISMLLDVILFNNDHLIASCDRDEKIRISRFPNSFVVEQFCLGHTEYVKSLCVIPLEDESILVSGDGIGHIKFWQPAFGTCLLTVNLKEHLNIESKTGLAVRKLTTVSRDLDLKYLFQVAVCFEFSKIVAVITGTMHSNEGRLSVQLKGVVHQVMAQSCSSDKCSIVDICSMQDRNLIILSSCRCETNELPVSVVQLSDDRDFVDSEFRNVAVLFNEIEGLKTDLKNCKDELCPSILQKQAGFDNEGKYLERKKQRLHKNDF